VRRKRIGFEHYYINPTAVEILYFAGVMVKQGYIEPFQLYEYEIEAFQSFPHELISSIKKMQKELLEELLHGKA